MFITKKEAKRKFSFIGLSLIFYILSLLYLPFLLDIYFKLDPIRANIGIDKTYIYIGLKLIVILFGSFIPFLFIKKTLDINYSSFTRSTNIKFSELLYYSSLMIAITSIIMFILTMLNAYLPVYGNLLYPIGLTQGEEYLNNYMYLFLFIFVTPLIEEFIFRGILLRGLGRFGNYFALITISLVYGLCNQTIGEIILGFVMSFYLIKVTLRYKSIQPAIFIHIISNAFFIGLQYIPYNNYSLASLAIVLVYVISIFAVSTRKITRVKVKVDESFRYIMGLFFSRVTVLIAISLSIAYPAFKIIINSL